MLFSIIIPTYNRVRLLKRCLTSLCDQTFKDFEVIICDDGSTDDSEAEVSESFSGLPISYIYMPNTGGPAAPRNRGIQMARGQWICFLDSDDFYQPNRLQRLSDIVSFRDADVYYHDLEVLDVEGRFVHRMKGRSLKQADPFHDLLFNLNGIATSSTCIRTETVKDYVFDERSEIAGLEDFDLWIRMAKRGCRFRYIPECLGFYSDEPYSLTDKSHTQIERFKVLYMPYIMTSNDRAEKRKIEAAMYYTIAKIAKEAGLVNHKFHWRRALLYGSFPIKMRVIYQFLRGLRGRKINSAL